MIKENINTPMILEDKELGFNFIKNDNGFIVSYYGKNGFIEFGTMINEDDMSRFILDIGINNITKLKNSFTDKK